MSAPRMDSDDHMLDPHWEPDNTPFRAVRINPLPGDWFHSTLNSASIRKLSIAAGPLDYSEYSHNGDSEYRDLYTLLGRDSSFPNLQHLKFVSEKRIQRWDSKIPSPVLKATLVLQRVEVVTFSAVSMPTDGLQEFLAFTKAHTLRFYSTRVATALESDFPNRFTVSTMVSYLVLRGLRHNLNRALLNGVLAQPNDSKGIQRKVNVKMHPSELTERLFDEVGDNWASCQILELKAKEGTFDRSLPGHIFQRLSADTCRFNNIKELRLSFPEFNIGSNCFFEEFLHHSPNLESLRIRGWTKVPHTPGGCLVREMVHFITILQLTLQPIMLVFEEAPFYVLLVLSHQISVINVKLLELHVEAPPDAWWPGNQAAGLRQLADRILAGAKKSKTLGVIHDERKRNWALFDCNGGIWIGVKDTCLLNPSDLDNLKRICLDNYNTESTYVFRNIRRIMQPNREVSDCESIEHEAYLHSDGTTEIPFGDADLADDSEDFEEEPPAHPSGANYVPYNSRTDRALHYL